MNAGASPVAPLSLPGPSRKPIVRVVQACLMNGAAAGPVRLFLGTRTRRYVTWGKTGLVCRHEGLRLGLRDELIEIDHQQL